jgi:hypothetical protein
VPGRVVLVCWRIRGKGPGTLRTFLTHEDYSAPGVA